MKRIKDQESIIKSLKKKLQKYEEESSDSDMEKKYRKEDEI